MSKLNKHKYPGAKRLMLEAQELKDNTEDYWAQPIDDNLFEWHFTVRGPPETAFEGGYYHGRMSFPTEYPMKPPSIIVFTPNGRFETNKKICLSISGYHPEMWQPSWSVRTALLALIAFMPTKPNRAIGSLDYSDEERRKLAFCSRTWRCELCGPIKELLVQPTDDKQQSSNLREATNGDREFREQESSGSSSGSSSDGDGEGPRDSSSRDESNDLRVYNSEEEQHSTTNSILNYRDPMNDSDQAISRSYESIFSRGKNYRGDSNNTAQNLDSVERRQAHSPRLVLKSVVVLLSLLILRRILMVIQA